MVAHNRRNGCATSPYRSVHLLICGNLVPTHGQSSVYSSFLFCLLKDDIPIYKQICKNILSILNIMEILSVGWQAKKFSSTQHQRCYLDHAVWFGMACISSLQSSYIQIERQRVYVKVVSYMGQIIHKRDLYCNFVNAGTARASSDASMRCRGNAPIVNRETSSLLPCLPAYYATGM